nr:hypothetical protein [Halomonas shengliensis]
MGAKGEQAVVPFGDALVTGRHGRPDGGAALRERATEALCLAVGDGQQPLALGIHQQRLALGGLAGMGQRVGDA